MISLATTQQYHCSTKIAMDNTCKLMQTPSLRNFPLSNSVTSDSLGFLSFWLAGSHTDFFPFLSSLYHLMFSLCTFFFYSIISYPSSPLVLLRYVSLKAQSFVLCSRPTYLAAYWIYSLIYHMSASDAFRHLHFLLRFNSLDSTTTGMAPLSSTQTET